MVNDTKRIFCGLVMLYLTVVLCACSFEEPLSELRASEDVEPDFRSAESCRMCHEVQYLEWKGSMMNYSAQSPTARKFEQVIRRTSGNFGPVLDQPQINNPRFRRDETSPQFRGSVDPLNQQFCIKCHAPLSRFLETNTLAKQSELLLETDQTSHFKNDVTKEGVTCIVCHSAVEPDTHTSENKRERGKHGDGIGNFSVILEFFDYFDVATRQFDEVFRGRRFSARSNNRKQSKRIFREDRAIDFSRLLPGDVNFVKGRVRGPTNPSTSTPLVESKFHGPSGLKYAENDYLRSPKFCGSCHDVRLPLNNHFANQAPVVLENLFTEWEQGPFNSTDNPFGKVTTCQDCHMSLYPVMKPTLADTHFPKVPVANVPLIERKDATHGQREYLEFDKSVNSKKMPKRRHGLHSFTAVSIPLTPKGNKDFNNTNSTTVIRYPIEKEIASRDENYLQKDAAGKKYVEYPLGQEARRKLILQSAVDLSLTKTPLKVATGSEFAPIVVTVENTGAGHRVPSGFSHEREAWINVVVKDESGKTLYESGYLLDHAHPETGEPQPDGRLNDEDLQDTHLNVERATYIEQPSEPLADYNYRPFLNRGLAIFRNVFMRRTGITFERIIYPPDANYIDNTRSLPMLETVDVKYDVPIPVGYSGRLTVQVRMRWRSFPPEFLRTFGTCPF